MQHSSADGNGLGAALRDYGLAELATAIDALRMRGSRVHAGVHRARKSIRRTRALLALGGAALGPGAALLDRQLRRVNRRLSPLRDAHALVETIDRLTLKARDEAVSGVLKRARRVAAGRRATLARTPPFTQPLGDAQALLMTLQAALHGLPWASLVAEEVIEAMAAAARKAEGARHRAQTRGKSEDWHRWRRRMRRMSQQHRAATSVRLAPVPPSLFDKNLTEQLGVMQDLSLLVEHCERDSPFSKPDRQVLRRFAEGTLARQRRRVASVVRGVGRS